MDITTSGLIALLIIQAILLIVHRKWVKKAKQLKHDFHLLKSLESGDCKCEVCGEYVPYDKSVHVDCTQKPFFKHMCYRCSKDHEFLPIIKHDKAGNGSCIDYIVVKSHRDVVGE